MANTGTVDIDFGTFPGNVMASATVTGQTTFNASSSYAEAWLMPRADTTDHTVMEHVIDAPRITVSEFSTGVGFTIYASARDGGNPLYGKYTVAWVWS